MVAVVTGASGFIGGVLVRTLLEAGRRVRAVDRRWGPTLEGLDIERVSADVLDPDSLHRAFAGADVVYHLAAVISVTGDPHGLVWAVNADGVGNVAEAALRAGVRRMVHCSSVHAFDMERSALPVTEQSPPATRLTLPVYDRSKAEGEARLRALVSRGLDAVIVNPTAVIGPLDFGPSRMGRVFDALFRRRLPAVVEGCFDWVDVRDVAKTLVAAESAGGPGENHLAPGHLLTVRQLADVVESASGVPVPRVTVPLWFARLWSPLANPVARRSGNPLWYTSESLHALRFGRPVSGAKAERVLGHHARPIEETIADIHRWFVDRTAPVPAV